MTLRHSAVVNVAVIGAGFISDYHIEGLAAAGGARVVALVGRSPERTAARAARFGIARVETDRAAVLADPAVDAVVVATPDATHEEIAIEALHAGKAVLLQKPMAMTAVACRRVLEAERLSGSRLTVSFMHRYFPEVAWLRERLAAGELGEIHAIRLRNATPGADWNAWFYQPGNVSGGVVMQLGVHGIDLCRHLFGPIADLAARAWTARPERVLRDGRRIRTVLEDNVLATYRLRAGPHVTHEMSYTEWAGCDRFRLEVYGERGTAWLRSERGAAALNTAAAASQGWVTPELETEPLGAAHHRHWLRIVRGEAPRDDTPEAGLASLLVAEGIYRAADSGRVAAVEDEAVAEPVP